MFVTRIAPSPTGLFHLGTARTAYINYLAARATGGKFILRIDDTDVSRNKDEYTQIILDSFDWLGLEYDEIHYQSKRTELYMSESLRLTNSGKARELANGAIALLLPKSLPESFQDTIAGTIPITQTNKDQIHERVILLRGAKIDPETKETLDMSGFGSPTYQLASLIDDYFLDVNYIIRGVDHITNTPKQIAIWCALNEVYGRNNKLPSFSHLGLIHSTTKDEVTGKVSNKKLSKRDGAVSLMDYRTKGYTPEAMLNFLLRLGWSPKGDSKEHTYIPKERAIELFLKGNLSNRAAQYDLNKLESLQRHYNKI